MRFNFLKNRQQNMLTNYEGVKAFALTPQLELYTAVATAALTDNFYEKADAGLQRIRELIGKERCTICGKAGCVCKRANAFAQCSNGVDR